MSASLPTPARKSAGFGLVEMMVALVIGLIVLGTVLAVYVSNAQAARFQTGLLRVQENGRFAIDVLSRTMRMAGYDDPDTSAEVGGNFVQGTTSSSGTVWTQSGMKSDGDTVAVRYEGGIAIRDCRGATTTADVVVINQYAVWTDADGVSHLICNTANGNGEPLAEGVEDMRVLYGIDPDGDGVANRYVGAGDVATWGQVVSLQIALLVNSVVPALGEDDAVCLGCVVFAGTEDRLVRAEFQTTIGLRN